MVVSIYRHSRDSVYFESQLFHVTSGLKEKKYATVSVSNNVMKNNELLILKLQIVIQRTFNACKIQLMFFTHSLVTPKLKDKLPRLATFCVHQFNCSCVVSYICRCFRNSNFHACEKIQVWLSKGTVKT